MSAPDRPTQTRLNATLRVAEDGRGDAHDARLLAVEVRALRAELDRAVAAHALCDSTARSLLDWCDGNFEPDELFNPPSAAEFSELRDRLRTALAARTPQPAAPVIYRCDQTRHPAGPCSRCELVTSAPLPAVPDGEAATCSCCNGDPLTVCAACEQHSCWAGRFMCDESRTAGTKQASPSPNREDDDRPVRWAWAAWLAESAEQADDLDDSERHGLRIAATHLLEDDIAARLNPGDFDPVADPAWALRFSARLWADVEAGRAARRVSAPPDGEDVPARLRELAGALHVAGWDGVAASLLVVARHIATARPEVRAAVAAALAARPTGEQS